MMPVGDPQLVTLTMNPAVDITTDTDRVLPTEKIRCGAARYDPGGGGINVARVAYSLGLTDVCAVFPAGGPTGALLTDLMVDSRVPFRGIAITAATRENLTVNETRSGQQFRFVLPGPTVAPAEQTACLEAMRDAAQSARFVVASGSLPPGVAADFYQRVADVCRSLGALFVLDTSGRGLSHITSGVYLLKVSVRELRECSGRDLRNDDEQVCAAKNLIATGRSRVVVISRGADGAMLITSKISHRIPAVSVPGGSGVGAGDAMVAAILVGLSRGWNLDKSMRLGVAAGAATMLIPGTATCTRSDVERLFESTSEPDVIA